ncbi:hypothetical protein Tco_0576750 [Tanacetum coccineum]
MRFSTTSQYNKLLTSDNWSESNPYDTTHNTKADDQHNNAALDARVYLLLQPALKAYLLNDSSIRFEMCRRLDSAFLELRLQINHHSSRLMGASRGVDSELVVARSKEEQPMKNSRRAIGAQYRKPKAECAYLAKPPGILLLASLCGAIGTGPD